MRTKRDASGTPTWRTQNDTNESDMKEEEPRPVRPGRGSVRETRRDMFYRRTGAQCGGGAGPRAAMTK